MDKACKVSRKDISQCKINKNFALRPHLKTDPEAIAVNFENISNTITRS